MEEERTALEVIVQSVEGVPDVSPRYELRLRGAVVGERGFIARDGVLNPGRYAAAQIVLVSDGIDVIRAMLPKELELPSGLLDDHSPARLRTKSDVAEEVRNLAAELAARFKAIRSEGLRRFRSIEIDWESSAFLGSTAADFKVKGEAKLALALLVSTPEDDALAAGTALAELSAAARLQIDINGRMLDRTYGVRCRCGLAAAVTLALDLDELNLSLPDVVLPSFDLSRRLALPAATITGKLGGAFSGIAGDLQVTYAWTHQPQLVLARTDTGLLFAIAGNGTYDLSGPPVRPDDLSQLTATVTNQAGFTLTAADVKLAVFHGGAVAAATVTVSGTLPVPDGARTMGPLRLGWEGVAITPEVSTATASAKAVVTFRRVTVALVDDPSTVLALGGSVELTPSSTQVLELRLVEPFPFVLVERGATALLRGAQRLIHVLGHIQPQTQGDVDDLERVLAVLGKIAVAVARSAVFVATPAGQALQAIAGLLSQAVVKVAELLAAAVRELGSLLDGLAPPDLVLTVEARIALEPLELRQIVLTLGGKHVEQAVKSMRVLGFRLDVKEGWRPGLLLDFVTDPGAYLFAINGSGAVDAPLAVLSTDLWLRRQDGVAGPVRDATAKDGERSSDQPLLSVTARSKDAARPLMIILAGLRQGKCVFFQTAKTVDRRSEVPVPGQPGVSVTVVDGAFKTEPLQPAIADLTIDFQPQRVLALLGIGEPGTEASATTGFLAKLQSSLSQIVTVKRTVKPVVDGRKVTAGVVLDIQAAGVHTEATLGVELDLDTLEVSFTGGDVFDLKSRRIEERALGLTWVVEQANLESRRTNAEVPMFHLAFAGGESYLELTDKAQMLLRFDGLSSDGEGVVFKVRTFRIGRGGLELAAEVDERVVRLNGVDVPFRFTSGRLRISGGVLAEAVVAGRGQLPPALVGEANCTAVLAFGLQNGEIVLQHGTKVELEKMGEPIACHGTRFTLTITHLELDFVRDGGYHFFFLVTGSVRFTPKPGEFESGLLQHLKDVEITIENAPLAADARVLLRHISFQKALNPKKTFTLFNLFTFELRGFGFHPASPKFEGQPPAIDISGQIRFADIGDVMQPKIDFHELWIAPPKANESLPRIKAEGLGLELQLAGAVKVRGAVLAVDPDTRTVEGGRFAPDGYNTYGFLGEGMLDIPGWGAMEASLGFLEVESIDHPGERKKAFFLYLQKDKLAVEIPTPIWVFYLREAGFGFGFRYTLAGIEDAESAKSAAQLVRILDDVSRRQGDLARFSAWRPSPEKDSFTLALRGAFQPFPAQKTYDARVEREAVSPFFFDIVAALRSDLTFLMSARGWLGVNYASFLENKGNFRERPTFRGFLYISVPRSELLLRAIADSTGFIGNDWPEVMPGQALRQAVSSVDWSTTLYIRPGLFHYEVGWPDQLAVRLIDEPNMRLVVRGGMIFRATDDGLLFGFNVGAEAFVRFEGRAGESIGVALVAELNARLVARVIAYLSYQFKGSLVYGLVSLDARLTFAVAAWMDVDLGFTSFTLNIGFSFAVQFTAAIELAISDGGVGGRVAARVAVQAFGCSLSVGIGCSFNDAQLDAARARVQRFLALSITAEPADAPPVFAARTGDEAVDAAALAASKGQQAPAPVKPPQGDPNLKPDVLRSGFGAPLAPTDFWLVLRQAGADENGHPAPAGFAYGLFAPREPEPGKSGFYAAPTVFDRQRRSEHDPVHRIAATTALTGVKVWRPGQGSSTGQFEPFDGTADLNARWNAPIAVPGGDENTFTLAYFFDECFLADTHWEKDGSGKPVRIATRWTEPQRRRHVLKDLPDGTAEERHQLRDRHQKARAADAIESPYDERAHQARSTVMTLFLDQFVTLATTGRRSGAEAHVTDLGLVVYGPAAELAKLAGATITKHDGSTSGGIGKVAVLNPPETWFDRQDPTLADPRQAVEHDGVKLGWRLVLPQGEPEHFLQHYEILRTVEGAEFTPLVLQVKPAATIGGREEDGEVALVAADWQFSDPLDDKGISPTLRRALLPVYGEAAALEAAKAWMKVVSGELVTITYTVTPVDIAGVRGLPRSFPVAILRPRVPIRAAVGEVRVVQTVAAAAAGAQDSEGPADDLEVYLALNDAAWDDHAPQQVSIGDAKYSVQRIYRLVIDPEDIEPAGHYGSDGSTARLRGSGAWLPMKTADEVAFKIPRNRTVDAAGVAAVREIEPEEAELRKLPRWASLSSKSWPDPQGLDEGSRMQFLAALWTRNPAAVPPRRVAARFFLETWLVFTDLQTHQEIPHVSTRVPLAIEHSVRVTGRRAAGQPTAALRPEALEWATPLVFPALGEGQVQAESGFAQFRVPTLDTRLGDLESQHQTLVSERDPERRVLTSVRFAAVPDWAGDLAKAAKPRPVHASCISGFDLYELDLDSLAPLDVAELPGKTLANDEAAWKRARRVARIEQLARDAAALVPAGNTDWQGWQAHYPSTTQRLSHARAARGGDSPPILSGWYSDRETTPHFPERRPRLRLLPLVPHAAVDELLRGGQPKRVTASLRTTPGTPSAAAAFAGTLESLPGLTLHEVEIHRGDPAHGPMENLLLRGNIFGPLTAAPRQTFFKVDGTVFDAKDLRNLLLCLGWAPFDPAEPAGDAPSVPPALQAWLDDPGALDGLVLVLAGEGDFTGRKLEWTSHQDGDGHVVVDSKAVDDERQSFATGTTEIPLDLRSPIHPILEEVIAELALEWRDARSVYRPYAVMPQPVTTTGAKDLAGFMATTAPEADPYGWKVLQALGAAVTVRLYDAARELFVEPRKLAARANAVLTSVLRRWHDAYAKNQPAFQAIVGQPFAEVFLRPGADRLAGPFDAVVDETDVEAAEPPRLALDDEGLAFIQLSLRPRPAAVWTYRLQPFTWGDLQSLNSGDRVCSLAFQIDGGGGELDAARARGGPIAELNERDRKAVLPIPLPGAAKAKSDDPDLDLFFRVKQGAARPKIRVAIERENVAVVGEAMDVKRYVEMIDVDAPGSPIHLKGDWRPVDEPASGPPDPFERFQPVSAERWLAAFTPHDDRDRSAAVAAFGALRQALRGAAGDGFAFPEPEAYGTVVGSYLSWAQRFLDHGAVASPSPTANPREGPHLAIAGPTKATPWKLAPDAEGYLRLSFLHSDRWGHARAYAVKPIARYHELLAGLGVEAQRQAAALVPIGNRDLGLAVAVSPRTEPVQPPVIVRSGIVGSDLAGDAIEIVVARHGEESLALSNRPVMAQLGLPTSLIAFSRSYRFPDWPSRLTKLVAIDPPAEPLPERVAALPQRVVDEAAQITEVSALAREYPGLWKGADVWHLAPIPPHYQVIALAAERSGIVVSDVATVVQDDLPRSPLPPFAAGSVTLRFKRDLDGSPRRVRLVLTQPLLSHAQLTPAGAQGWLGGGGLSDVCWWPDPDVSYTLLRRLRASDAKTIAEKEDLEVRLVAADGKDLAQARPIVLRARGDSFAVVESDDLQRLALRSGPAQDDAGKREFILESSLQLQAEVKFDSVLLGAGEYGTQEQIDAFNRKAATVYAAILTPYALTIDLPPKMADTAATYVDRLKKLAELLRMAVDTLGHRTERWFTGGLTREARARTEALERWIQGVGSTLDPATDPAKIHDLAGLPLPFGVPWVHGVDLPRLLPAGNGADADEKWEQLEFDKGVGTYLVLWDIAADDELALAMQDGPPAVQPKHTLHARLARQILGGSTGFWLKAVDGRARIGADHSTPGVTEVLVDLPDWLSSAIREGGAQ